MAFFRICTTSLVLVLALISPSWAQIISPSNDTADIPPYKSSPRFLVLNSDFGSLTVLPLGWYASIPQSNFQQFEVDAPMVYVNVSNARSVPSRTINYVSCDPEDYPQTGGMFAAADIRSASDILQSISGSSRTNDNSIILFSTRYNHCNAINLRTVATNGGIFTTLDSTAAKSVLSHLMSGSSSNDTKMVPDRASYTSNSGNTGSPAQGGQTAVAMIILYTITGIITALFVCIIATGAIRAHRHPERYGPRNLPGGTRRSRAKGIARAMLDTLPIVKFGEKEQPKEIDIEMSPPVQTQTDPTTKDKSATVVETVPARDKPTEIEATAINNKNADGTDDQGQLGCSICTDDFNKGEEVRLLPCNHKFHPICVDPWLLNVSGTCPLCRIDLRPKEEQEATSPVDELPRNDSITRTMPFRRNSILNFEIAPPLGYIPSRASRDRVESSANRRDTTSLANLRSVALGSREERLAALRQLRQQRRAQESEQPEQEEERRGISSRLRDRFRIRTRRQGEEEGETSAARQQQSIGVSRATWHT